MAHNIKRLSLLLLFPALIQSSSFLITPINAFADETSSSTAKASTEPGASDGRMPNSETKAGTPASTTDGTKSMSDDATKTDLPISKDSVDNLTKGVSLPKSDISTETKVTDSSSGESSKLNGEKPSTDPTAKSDNSAPSASTKRIKKRSGLSFMWRVKDKHGHTLYLLGSMHAMPPSIYPLPSEIENAFAQSTDLAVEADVTKLDMKKAFMLVAAKGMYTNGEDLDGHLSQRSKDALRDYLDKHSAKIPPALPVKKFKPWLAGVMLVAMRMMGAGLSPSAGIDAHFLKEANEQKKEIHEIESAESQIDLLADMSDKLQDDFLYYSLIEEKSMEHSLDTMLTAWKSGDSKSMNMVVSKSLLQNPDLAELVQTVIYDRNDAMTKRIEEFLGSDSRYFVVVGAAHLVGDKGIVSELRSHKFKLKQVKCKQAL